MGPSGTVKMFLVGESHSPGGEKLAVGATAALGFLLRTYSIAWCTLPLPIMRSGVGRGKRSEFGPPAEERERGGCCGGVAI